jgi:hypothetical protein
MEGLRHGHMVLFGTALATGYPDSRMPMDSRWRQRVETSPSDRQASKHGDDACAILRGYRNSGADTSGPEKAAQSNPISYRMHYPQATDSGRHPFRQWQLETWKQLAPLTPETDPQSSLPMCKSWIRSVHRLFLQSINLGSEHNIGMRLFPGYVPVPTTFAHVVGPLDQNSTVSSPASHTAT